jgi:hypothetical protein
VEISTATRRRSHPPGIFSTEQLPSLPVQQLPAAGWLENWRQDAAITGNQDGCRHRFRQLLKTNGRAGMDPVRPLL